MGIEFEAWDERIDARTHIVGVRGEIDLFTAPEFKQRINASIERGTPLVVIDLTDTTFVDSSSLGVLIAAQRRQLARDGRMVVVCSNRAVMSTFRITGLEGVLEIVRTRAEALEDEPAPAAAA